ncbi:MAG TPA: RNA polymerase subunit sigma-70 [Propionibacteriaceae bacterium]|nr:RNA polymerase subunit sigma-70 [Propionibacteriaceae bacterium]
MGDGGGTDLDFAERAEHHRSELQVHCYRMLGSFTDAEDLTQETLLRAWRHRDDLREGDNVRAWLYKIATNACLDHIKAHRRRVPSLASFRDIPWLEPYPDRLLAQSAPAGEEPPARAIERETIALTFLAVIQLLPARQRAAIILRDVLEWPVPDIAALLDLSPAAVNSALQRGRATLRTQLPRSERDTWAAKASNQAEREVLDAYIAAYESGDEDATFALVTDDIRITMPPAPYLFEGLAALRQLVDRARDTGTWRLLPTWANRQPAAACYLLDPASGEFRAFKLDVLGLAGGKIAEITAFDPKHFPAFGLVAVLP